MKIDSNNKEIYFVDYNGMRMNNDVPLKNIYINFKLEYDFIYGLIIPYHKHILNSKQFKLV
jgi:hypothetical protein